MVIQHHLEIKLIRIGISHDDVIKWNHFPRYWPFVRGIHRSPVNSPHKGQWRGALMLSLFCVWINGCVNNREVGDLRRYRTHYDVTAMLRDMCLKSTPMVCHVASGPSVLNWRQNLHVASFWFLFTSTVIDVDGVCVSFYSWYITPWLKYPTGPLVHCLVSIPWSTSILFADAQDPISV